MKKMNQNFKALNRNEMKQIMAGLADGTGLTNCSNSCVSITDCNGKCSCNDTTCTCTGKTKTLTKSCPSLVQAS